MSNRFKEPKRELSGEESQPGLDIRDADRVCGKPRNHYEDRCQICGWKTIRHCEHCRIRVTGCRCTKDAREEEAQHYQMTREEPPVRNFDQRLARAQEINDEAMRKERIRRLTLPGS